MFNMTRRNLTACAAIATALSLGAWSQAEAHTPLGIRAGARTAAIGGRVAYRGAATTARVGARASRAAVVWPARAAYRGGAAAYRGGAATYRAGRAATRVYRGHAYPLSHGHSFHASPGVSLRFGFPY